MATCKYIVSYSCCSLCTCSLTRPLGHSPVSYKAMSQPPADSLPAYLLLCHLAWRSNQILGLFRTVITRLKYAYLSCCQRSIRAVFRGDCLPRYLTSGPATDIHVHVVDKRSLRVISRNQSLRKVS
jgi:hypothetical protein